MAHQYRIIVDIDGIEFSFVHVIALKTNPKDPGAKLAEIMEILWQKRREIFGTETMPKITGIDEL